MSPQSANFDRLRLKNVRCFRDAEIPFDELTQLSDGYQAILAIVLDLMLLRYKHLFSEGDPLAIHTHDPFTHCGSGCDRSGFHDIAIDAEGQRFDGAAIVAQADESDTRSSMQFYPDLEILSEASSLWTIIE
jgi:hypothetical protein